MRAVWLVIVATLAGAADAQTQDRREFSGPVTARDHAPPANGLVTDPYWATTPSASELTAAFPAKAEREGVNGETSMVCRFLADGAVTGCNVESETPSGQGFGEAALSVARYYRIQLAGLNGARLEDLTIHLRIVWRSPPKFVRSSVVAPPPVVLTPPVMRGRSDPLEMVAFSKLSFVTNPDWIQRPSGERLAALYPRRALRQGVNGHTTTTCVVEADGTLAKCVVREETPTGYGFGAAALASTSDFRMRPRLIDGRSAAGAKVDIPLTWRLM